MNLSEAQVHRMTQAATLDFERRLAAHLRSVFAHRLAPLDNEQLQAAVRACREKAMDHGIDREDDVRRFAEFAVSYGLALDRNEAAPWIGSVLRMDDLTGTERMDVLDLLEARFVGGAT